MPKREKGAATPGSLRHGPRACTKPRAFGPTQSGLLPAAEVALASCPLQSPLSAMSYSFRPLPSPPGPQGYYNLERPMGSQMGAYSSDPYFSRYPNGPRTPRTAAPYPPRDAGERPSVLAGGTLLHKGFYDLLSLIPTPSPSRFLQGWTQPPATQVLAGPRYEEIGQPGAPAFGKPISRPRSPPSSPPLSTPPPKKGRRVSKDMVSKPTNFVYVHLISSSNILTLFQPFSSCVRRRPIGGDSHEMGS